MIPLPIFPLGQALMPGRPLSLRVFESRYRAMLADLRRSGQRSFGVVMLSQGLEVQTSWARGPDVRQPGGLAEVGTVAEIIDLSPAPGSAGGGYSLTAVGSRRFRIESLFEGKPYLQAEVSYLDEADGDIPEGLPERLLQLYAEFAGVLAARSGQALVGFGEAPPPSEANYLSYHLAATFPLPPADRLALLALPDAATRLSRIQTLLRRETILLNRTGTVAVGPEVLRLPFRPN